MQKAQRLLVLARVLAGKLSVPDAALLLKLSARSIRRLRARLESEGPEALVHGNRGRRPAHALDPALRARIVELARTTYAGCNDSHLAELLREREGIDVSRRSVQRILRAAGIASPRRRRPPKYRSRRERRAAEGMLVQLDASRHRWFGEDGDEVSLLAAIDDATGCVLAALFREQEDAAGYLELLRQLLAGYGVPLTVYSDRHTALWKPKTRGRDARRCARPRAAAHPARARLRRARGGADLPQLSAGQGARGADPRHLPGPPGGGAALAGIRDSDAANRFLPGYLTRYSARFAKPPQDPAPAWRPLHAGVSIESVCCLKYSRLVAADNTITFAGQVLQLPPKGLQGSWRHERVEVRHHLDGSFSVHAPGGRELARSATARVTPTLRAQDTPAPLGGVTPLPRSREHPWRTWQPGQFRGRNARIPPGAAGVTESRSKLLTESLINDTLAPVGLLAMK